MRMLYVRFMNQRFFAFLYLFLGGAAISGQLPSGKQSDGVIGNLTRDPQFHSGQKYFNEIPLRKTIEKGAYGMVESTSKHFATASRGVKLERFASLSRDLTELNLPHKPIIGVYKGHKTDISFLVIKLEIMTEETFKKLLFSLGRKYEQESIIFSAGLRGRLKSRNDDGRDDL